MDLVILVKFRLADRSEISDFSTEGTKFEFIFTYSSGGTFTYGTCQTMRLTKLYASGDQGPL